MGLLFPITSLVNMGATIPNTSQSSKRRCVDITLHLACLWVHQEPLQRQTWPETAQYEWGHGGHSVLPYWYQQTRESAKKEQKQRRQTDKPAVASLPTISLVWFNGFWRNGSYCSKWLLTIFRVTQASYTVAPSIALIRRGQQSQLQIAKKGAGFCFLSH